MLRVEGDPVSGFVWTTVGDDLTRSIRASLAEGLAERELRLVRAPPRAASGGPDGRMASGCPDGGAVSGCLDGRQASGCPDGGAAAPAEVVREAVKVLEAVGWSRKESERRVTAASRHLAAAGEDLSALTVERLAAVALRG